MFKVARYAASVSFLSLLALTPLRSDEIHVVRFFTLANSLSTSECLVVGWRDHLLFHNTTGLNAVIRPLAASNGHVPPVGDILTIPPGRSQSVMISPGNEVAVSNQWTPVAPYVLVVNRLDVPPGVLVESRTEPYGAGDNGQPAPCSPFGGGTSVLGSASLPVVKDLTPPDVPQYHLRTDVGTLNSRTNVGIYNGGSVSATAAVEIREGCDEQVLDSRLVTVPPNSVVLATGFATNAVLTSRCTGSQGTPLYVRYVKVLIDQPGFSFVTSLANDLPPKIAVTSSN